MEGASYTDGRYVAHMPIKMKVQNSAALTADAGKRVTKCWEPTVSATIIIPSEYVGVVITLCYDRRGEQSEYTFIDR
ncbi:hypothetical protein C5167_007544 [Papaver somniferum]|nr:hypothetical protein C5167_007544 [Papaver somniferum]